MALTFGFYNSVEGDRVYDAVQFGQIFDGIITDGIYATYKQAMVVKASENAGEVIIQPGRAWFNHTWSYNDADLVMTAPAPEVLLDRVDALVLDINEEQNVRTNSFIWVQGTPASVNPERPTLIHTTTHNQYPLCYIRRHAETTTIYTEDITNMVGTSECPFVAGVLEGVDVDIWLAQWDAEFHTWENAKQTAFEAWFQNIRDQLDEDAAGHLQNEIDDLKAITTAHTNTINTHSNQITALQTVTARHSDQLTANNTSIYMDYHDGKYGVNTSSSRGADTFIPFKELHIVEIGTFSGYGTFNLSSYDDYQSFTVNNFMFGDLSITVSGSGSWNYGANAENHMVVSYDSSTGLLSVNNGSASGTTDDPENPGTIVARCGGTIHGKVYLVYA